MTFYPFGVISSPSSCFQTHAILEAFISIPGISHIKSASPASRTPFPVGMGTGKAPGTGIAGLDPAGAPAFGSTSQPAWAWNAGEASSSARKNCARNSRKNRGIIFLKEFWWQILVVLRVVARPGSAPRGVCWVHPCGSRRDLSLEFRCLWQTQTCSQLWKWIKVSRGPSFLPHGDQLESAVLEAVPQWPNPLFPMENPFPLEAG